MKALLLLLICLPLVMLAQKKYPPLQNEANILTLQTIDNKYYDVFSCYQKVTTKNDSIAKNSECSKNCYPWDDPVSGEEKVKRIINEIEKSIVAYRSENATIPSNNIDITFKIDVLSEEQKEKYNKENYIYIPFNYLKQIGVKVSGYKLYNEKQTEIKLKDPGIMCFNADPQKEENNIYLKAVYSISDNESDFNYYKLTGYINLEFEIITEYEKVLVTANDIGKEVTIGNDTIKVLALESNVFHFSYDGTKKYDFRIYINDCIAHQQWAQLRESTSVYQTVYDVFRANPGLDFDTFKSKLEKKEITWEKSTTGVRILRASECRIDSVYLYRPIPSKILKKTIQVPVNIIH
jgi:hypothetical protein